MRDTERLILAALVGLDIGWWAETHVKALLANGGTQTDARAVVDLVHAVADAVGAKIEDPSGLYNFIRDI